MPDIQLARRDGVELARVGSWPTSTGRWDATTDDFQAAVEALDCPAIDKPRLWIGHTDQRFTPRDGEPAIGWVENLRADGESLTGDYVGVPAWLDQVMASAYPRRSIEGAYNRRCALGHRHPFVIDGVSLLGVTRPGVGVLKPLSDLDDVKALYGLAASGSEPTDGEVRIMATITGGLVLAHMPGRHDQDDHGHGVGNTESPQTDSPRSGNSRAPATADKLKLATRIKLGAGQSLTGSDVVSTDQGAIPVAAISAPDGPRIRIGVGIADEDKRRWSAANRGGTADLDAGQADELRDALGGMFEAGAALKTQVKGLERRERDLFRRQRDLTRAQFPGLNSAQGKELDRLDERLPEIDRQLAAIDAREQERVGRLPEDLQAKWRDAGPAERQAIIADWHESQPEWRGLVRSLHGRDMQGRERLTQERETAGARRAELTANREPLSADRADELATVRQELADLGDAYDRLDALEGVVAGDWADIVYETHLDDGEVKYWLGVRPKGATDAESVPLTPALIKKLDSVLERLADTASGKVRAATETHSGAMVALIPAAEDAERLAVEGGELAESLHVTLAYLGDAADLTAADRQDVIDAVSTSINGAPVIAADVFYIAPYNPPGVVGADGRQRDTCIVAGLSGDDLALIHTLVHDALVRTGAPLASHAPWHAHMTLLYSNDLQQALELVDRVGPVRFDTVRIALAGQHIDIPLIGEPEPAEVTEDGQVAAAADENVLKRYWLGEGLNRWATKRHPWTTLFRLLRKHVGAERAKRIASQWFHDHFGYWPGDRRHRDKVSAAATSELPAAEPETVTTEMEEDIVSDLSEFRSRLGLSDDADEAAMLAALDVLKTKADTPPSPGPEQVAASAAAEEAEKKVAAATAEAADLRKEVEILASTVKDVTTKLAASEAEKASTVKASVLDDAVKKGKIKPADKSQWEKDYDEAPAAVTRVLASIADGTAVPVTVAGETGDPEGVGDIDAEWRAVSHLFPETSKEG